MLAGVKCNAPPKVYNPPYSCSLANDVSFCNSVQTWEKRVVGPAVRGQPATHFFGNLSLALIHLIMWIMVEDSAEAGSNHKIPER